MDIFSKENLIKNNIISASYKTLAASIPTHIHNCFEIEYIISGSGTYILDGVRYPICDHMLFFLPPSSFHSFENMEADIINIMFPCSTGYVSPLFHLALSHAQKIQFSEENLWLEKIMDEIVLSCQNGNYNYSISFLQSLLYKITSLSANQHTRYTSYVQAATIYLLENFQEDISLNNVAEQLGIVPSYLSTLFSKEMNVNFKTYLDDLRFDYATKLLSFTSTSITNVCLQSGFTDYAHFSQRFKKKYGTTPKGYRNLHQTKQ